MTVTFGFYNSVEGDRVYSANEFGSLFDGIIIDGIFESVGAAFGVREQTGLNMNIVVGSGRCWFDRTWLYNSADLVLAIATANPVLDRIDTVIIEVDSSDAVRANSIKVLTGTADATPVPPTLTDTATKHQYRLADIYVTATVTAITDEDITSFIGTEDTPYARTLGSAAGGSGGFGGLEFIDQSGGTADTFGILGGTIDGTNKTFTVSKGSYFSGSMKVWLNGQLQTQGINEDYVELAPTLGTFLFATPPQVGDEITATYQTTESYILTPNRNLLIDGAMQIAQAGTSTSGITSSTTYQPSVDMWKFVIGSLGTWTLSQYAGSIFASRGYANAFKLQCTAANASPTAGAYLYFRQQFEGRRLQHLKKGTADAESLTLSFDVYSSKTGTFVVELLDIDNLRHICAAVTVNSANTVEHKTVTFTGDTTGALDNDSSTSIQLNFWLGGGSDFTSGTLATSWASFDNANRAVGISNWADSISNNFHITGAQLEIGDQASEFEYLPFDTVLQKVMHYYQKSFPYATKPATGAGTFGASRWTAPLAGASTHYVPTIRFPVPMRTTPTCTLYNPTNANAQAWDANIAGDCSSTVIAGATSAEALFINTVGNPSTNVGNPMFVNWTADARL